ncbi:UNVERIFIED_CONTAM: hypothetical protein FKN15_037494 [Acipenser sinensis]
MGRSGRRKQQLQQRGASRRSHCISTTLDVCPTCLKGEEWCFAVGEVGHIAPDQPPPWQEKEEPERPLREDLHPPKRTNALSSEGVWDWLVEPGRDYEEALTAVINLLWARDGERWEAWEQQHHPASLPDIAAMVLNYLAADMGETLLLPSPAPKGEEPSLPSPAPKGEEPSLPSPPAEGECLLVSAPPPEGQEHECPQPKMRTEEEECLLFPSPPAEGEYLLVSPSLPRGEEDQELPPQSQHYPLSTVFPATEGDQHQSPATEGDYPLLSPPPPGNYLLLLPPSSGGDCPQLPPPPAEGEFLLVPSPLPWEDCLQLPPESVRPQPKEGGVGASTAQRRGSRGVHSPKGRSRGIHSPRGRSRCVQSPIRSCPCVLRGGLVHSLLRGSGTG